MNRTKGLDVAGITIGHEITIATGVLALSVVFLSEDTKYSCFEKVLLVATWIFLFASVASGLWALHAIASIISKVEASVNDDSLRFWWNSQLLTLGIGLLSFVFFGVAVMFLS